MRQVRVAACGSGSRPVFGLFLSWQTGLLQFRETLIGDLVELVGTVFQSALQAFDDAKQLLDTLFAGGDILSAIGIHQFTDAANFLCRESGFPGICLPGRNDLLQSANDSAVIKSAVNFKF